MTIFVDLADKEDRIPEFNQDIKCPEHPDLDPETGYGMAGGGMGIYSFCGECDTILSKTIDPIE